MEIITMIPTLILYGGIGYTLWFLANKYVFSQTITCDVCDCNCRTSKQKGKVKCEYCESSYIIKNDGTIIRA